MARARRGGAHVVYGIVGLKTTRRRRSCSAGRTKCSSLLPRGTGNDNSKTARIYEDIGVLTSDADIGADVGELFDYLTGFSKHADYREILVSSGDAAQRIMAIIEEQAEADRWAALS